ncbi:MAG: hypothetical protein LLG93_04115 [Deltaproteobacteria bacterium]|nr:hypothetical protein [Deltaproteobacteria bacterium]
MDLNLAKERLAKNKVTAGHDQTLHDLAGKINVTPIDILKILLVENYQIYREFASGCTCKTLSWRKCQAAAR